MTTLADFSWKRNSISQRKTETSDETEFWSADVKQMRLHKTGKIILDELRGIVIKSQDKYH